ncbi:uncharacterized protein Dvar_81980 [Desulfosarcina variabilis str. Montpellier]
MLWAGYPLFGYRWMDGIQSCCYNYQGQGRPFDLSFVTVFVPGKLTDRTLIHNMGNSKIDFPSKTG